MSQSTPNKTRFASSTPVWLSFKEQASKQIINGGEALPAYLEAIVESIDPKDPNRYIISFPSLDQQPSSQTIRQELARLPQHSTNEVTSSKDSPLVSVSWNLLEMREDSTNADDPKQYLDMNDLVQLPNLNEPELLKAIGHRYMQDKIFSYVGPTLLVVNPYKKINDTFAESTQSAYESLVFAKCDIAASAAPHIFAIAAQSIQSILTHRSKKQAIVISGESGAGKTENTKYAMNFLTHINSILDSSSNSLTTTTTTSHRLSTVSNQVGTTEQEVPIEKRILNCNPILEAFGNAKTTRNDNSSRFGKLVVFHFSPRQSSTTNPQGTPSQSSSLETQQLQGSPPPSQSKRKQIERSIISPNLKQKVICNDDITLMSIQSATLTNYLLEKSRIVRIQPQERNYHIFYFLLAGASSQFLDSLGISTKNPIHFKYLQSECQNVDKLNDVELFEEVCASLNDLRFSEAEQSAIWSIISAVLLLGNLEFTLETQSEEGTQSDKVVFAQTSETDSYATHLTKKFNCSLESLIEALTTKRIEVNKQVTMSPLKMQEVLENRDSLSKYLYDSLFQFLVRRLNESIAPTQLSKPTSNNNINSNASIELLDIFGFEVFAENSFEQLCINFANEKLQQLYISYIYEGEKKLFKEQNLSKYLNEIVYTDNKQIIEALERAKDPPIGVFPLIDESSSIMQGTDATLIASIKKQHAPPNIVLSFPQRNPLRFAVHHSAGPVEYTITDFRAKNKDEVSLMLQNLVKHPQLRIILNAGSASDNQSTSSSSSSKSLGSKFRTQMKALMDELQSCECQFVRCIKPNALKQPNLVETRYSLNQINCLGVLETIRVRKQGYAYRAPYARFYFDHWHLSPPQKSFPNTLLTVEAYKKDNLLSLVQQLVSRWIPLEDIEANNVLLGETLIFMRDSLVNLLQAKQLQIKESITRSTQVIQRYFRAKQMRRALKRIHRIKSTLMMIVFRFRFLRTDAMKRLRELRRSKATQAKYQSQVKRIQRFFRAFMTRKHQAIQQAARKIIEGIQKFRERRARKARLELTHTFIKSKLAMLKQRRAYAKLLSNIIFIQACFRGYSSRKYLSIHLQISNAITSAWNQIRIKASTQITAWTRMILVKLHNYDIVLASRKAGNIIRERNAILIIQKSYRYYKFKAAFLKYRNAAIRIQAYLRMRWCALVYALIQNNVRFIQKHIRNYLQEKYYLAEKWTYSFDWNSIRRDALYAQQNLLSLGIPFKKHSKSLLPSNSSLAQAMSAANITNPAMVSLKSHYVTMYTRQMEIKRLLLHSSSIQSANNSIDLQTQKQSYPALPSTLQTTQSYIQMIPQIELTQHQSSTNTTSIHNNIQQQSFYFRSLALSRESESENYSREAERQKERIGNVMRLDAEQIPLKTIIIDFDQLPSSHEIYATHRWAHTYTNLERALASQHASILRILVSEVSTTIVADNQTVTNFGSLFDELSESQLQKQQQQQSNTSSTIESHRTVNSFQFSSLDSVFVGNAGQVFVKQANNQLFSWGENTSYDDNLLTPTGDDALQEPFLEAPSLMKVDGDKSILELQISTGNSLLTSFSYQDQSTFTYSLLSSTPESRGNLDISQIASIEQEKLTKNFAYLFSDGTVVIKDTRNNRGNSKQLGKLQKQQQQQSHQFPFQSEFSFEDVSTLFIRVRFSTLISCVSCGGSFTLFLTQAGQVFARGKNSSGELGMNDRREREFPEEIGFLRKVGEKVTGIACGLKHALCVTSLGKVFAWGNNRFGQLGLGDTKNRLKPERVYIRTQPGSESNLQNTIPLTQLPPNATITATIVRASMRASICAGVAVNDMHTSIYWWGTNGNLQIQTTPISVNIATYLPNAKQAKDFVILKVLTSWSQNLSVTYVIGADLQHTAPNKRHALLKHLAVLSKQWQQQPQYQDKVFPPPQKSLDKFAQIATPKIPHSVSQTHSKLKQSTQSYSSISHNSTRGMYAMK